MSNLPMIQQFHSELMSTDHQEQLKSVLPSHVTIDQFVRATMVAVQSNPNVLNADRQSLFSSLQKCATDGLIPDNKEAALVEFNTKDKQTNQFVKKIQYLPMVAGVMKRARQSGVIATIAARCVYENDEFDYWIDEDGEHMKHRPKFGGDRGNMILVYAMAKMTSGEVVVEPMDMNEINKVKNASKTSKFGPWVDWFERMAEKSALHRLTRRLPNSSELSEMMDRDNWMYDFNKKEERDITPAKNQQSADLRSRLQARRPEPEVQVIEDKTDQDWAKMSEQLIEAANNSNTVGEINEIVEVVKSHDIPLDLAKPIGEACRARKKILSEG